MRSVARHFSCFLVVLGLAVGTLVADAPFDTVTLKDGRVLKGQVVEESKSQVGMLLNGVHRNFNRDFIAKIVYWEGPDADAAVAQASAVEAGPGPGAPSDGADYGAPMRPAGTGAMVPTLPKRDLFRALSQRYQVPVGDVVWVSEQGVPPADLSLVFLVAATARVTPRQVVKLYHQGWSWNEIENYFQMQPDDVYYEYDGGVDYPYYVPYGWDWGGWGGWGWNGAYGWNGGGYGWGHGRGGGGAYHGGGSYGGGHVGWNGGGGRASVGGAHAWVASSGGHASGGGSHGGAGSHAGGHN